MKKIFMAIALSLSLFGVSCYEDTAVTAVADIDATIAEVDAYIIEVEERRALSRATVEDKALVLHSVGEIRRLLYDLKESRKSVRLLTLLFGEYKILVDYPMTTADMGALSPMVSSLHNLIIKYQNAINVVVGIYMVDTFAGTFGNWSEYAVSVL